MTGTAKNQQPLTRQTVVARMCCEIMQGGTNLCRASLSVVRWNRFWDTFGKRGCFLLDRPVDWHPVLRSASVFKGKGFSSLFVEGG